MDVIGIQINRSLAIASSDILDKIMEISSLDHAKKIESEIKEMISSDGNYNIDEFLAKIEEKIKDIKVKMDKDGFYSDQIDRNNQGIYNTLIDLTKSLQELQYQRISTPKSSSGSEFSKAKAEDAGAKKQKISDIFLGTAKHLKEEMQKRQETPRSSSSSEFSKAKPIECIKEDFYANPYITLVEERNTDNALSKIISELESQKEKKTLEDRITVLRNSKERVLKSMNQLSRFRTSLNYAKTIIKSTLEYSGDHDFIKNATNSIKSINEKMKPLSKIEIDNKNYEWNFALIPSEHSTKAEVYNYLDKKISTIDELSNNIKTSINDLKKNFNNCDKEIHESIKKLQNNSSYYNQKMQR